MQIFTQLVLLKGLQAAIFFRLFYFKIDKRHKSMKTKNQPYHKLLNKASQKVHAVWKQRG